MIKSFADCKVINRLCTVAHRTASDVPKQLDNKGSKPDSTGQ